MSIERPLPGYEPAFIRFQIALDDDGYYTVDVAAASAPGFVTRADSDVYEELAGYEVADVVSAVLDTLLRL